jgi:hypothetical protein
MFHPLQGHHQGGLYNGIYLADDDLYNQSITRGVHYVKFPDAHLLTLRVPAHNRNPNYDTCIWLV